MTEISLQDRLVQYGELTEIAEDQIFRKKEEGVKVVKRERDLLVEIYFELDYDKTVIERQIYTVLDFLSDIGGIQSIFMIIFSVVLFTVNYKRPEAFIASKLYKIKRTDDNQEAGSDNFKP